MLKVPKSGVKSRVYLEVETVEELTDEYEGGEEDLQSVHVCSVSMTQVNSRLQHTGKRHR